MIMNVSEVIRSRAVGQNLIRKRKKRVVKETLKKISEQKFIQSQRAFSVSSFVFEYFIQTTVLQRLLGHFLGRKF